MGGGASLIEGNSADLTESLTDIDKLLQSNQIKKALIILIELSEYSNNQIYLGIAVYCFVLLQKY